MRPCVGMRGRATLPLPLHAALMDGLACRIRDVRSAAR